MDIRYTLLITVTIIMLSVSFMIWHGKKDSVSKVFSFFILCIGLWALGIFLFMFINNDYWAKLIAEFYYIVAFLIPTFFLYFSLVLHDKKDVSKISKIAIFLPVISLIILFAEFGHNFLFKGIINYQNYKDVNLILNNYIFYILFFILFLLIAYYKLIKVYFKTNDQIEKSQIKFVIYGTLPTYLCAMYFDLILPVNDYSKIWIGPLFGFGVVIIIFYAIYRHHLFNIRVIAAEILAYGLMLFIFVRTLISSSVQEAVLNLIFFIVISIIGIFLIKSVANQVAQKEELEEANAGQANLIHIMNHQIKGYLTIDKNIFAELLTDDYGKIPDEAKDIITKGLESTDKGVKYVTDILKGASAESGNLFYDMKKTDFKEIVLNEIENKKEIIEKKNLKLNVDISPGDYNITGDITQLSEAVRNLIENSIYYTPEGSISIYLKNKTGKIIFSVKDTGVGIKEEDKSKIFKAGGVGADSIKVNVNSSGYGLVFAKSVMKKHGGRVWFESDGYNKGSTFYAELPIK